MRGIVDHAISERPNGSTFYKTPGFRCAAALRGRVRTQPDTMPQDVFGEFLYVLGIHLIAPMAKQRPYLRKPRPYNRRAWRGAKVHALFDHVRR